MSHPEPHPAARPQRGRWRRAVRHLWASPLQVRRALPPAALARIEATIADGEQHHRAELRFAVEAALSLTAIWNAQTARARALEVFSQHRIWDTEANNGVLVYLLWADRAVEIVADRDAVRRVDPTVWRKACDQIARARRSGDLQAGILRAIECLNHALAVAYPADEAAANPDELPDSPLLL